MKVGDRTVSHSSSRGGPSEVTEKELDKDKSRFTVRRHWSIEGRIR